MNDKDIMDPNVYQIKKNDWEVINTENEAIYKILAYKLSSWSENTYLIVKVNKKNNYKSIIIDWNSKDFVFSTHNLLNSNMLIVRASLEKSKTTRMFDISKFKDIVKN